jgi:hypothetical protein
MTSRIAGPRFGDYQAGFRFGQLGYELVERRGLRGFEASTFNSFAVFVVPWMKHERACCDLLRRAFDSAKRTGDLTYGAYSCNCLNSELLFAGEPLPEVEGEAEHGLAFAEKAGFAHVVDFITTQLALIRMLRGVTPKFGCFDDGYFDESRSERRLVSEPVLAVVECWYWIRKLQARFFVGDYAAAMDAASKAQPLLWTPLFFEEAEFHFYSALSRAASYELAAAHERQQHLDVVATHLRQLQIWAKNCPENFENRAALVSAEIARIPRELPISTERSGSDEVLVAVRDSGPGIDPEHLKRVFDSFYATKPSGVGLGSQSAARSSMPTADGCGRMRTNPKAPYSTSPCRPETWIHEFSAGGLPRSTAFRTQPMSSLSSNGLGRLQTIPSFRARARAVLSGYAVTKMVGI